MSNLEIFFLTKFAKKFLEKLQTHIFASRTCMSLLVCLRHLRLILKLILDLVDKFGHAKEKERKRKWYYVPTEVALFGEENIRQCPLDNITRLQ